MTERNRVSMMPKQAKVTRDTVLCQPSYEISLASIIITITILHTASYFRLLIKILLVALLSAGL